MELKVDCWHYIGDRPCLYNRLCDGCDHYEPIRFRALIIKLAAAGDVLRTTTLLRALKSRRPEVHITWLTEPGTCELLRHAPLIDRLLPFGFEALARLRAERFDEVYCFDKEAHAAVLATEVHAARRVGFGFSSAGGPCPLNPESEYLFSLGLSDELKFNVNQKTYQELIFASAGFPFSGEEYVFEVPEEESAAVEQWLAGLGSDGTRKRIGVNTGAGPVFANKAWTRQRFLEFVELAAQRLDADILLLGGPDEEERNAWLAASAKVPVIETGCLNPLMRFAAIVKSCTLLVTGDTMAMHIAIGLRRPVVALFGSTCAQEVELYGRGQKISTPLDCAPCFKRRCEIKPSCMDVIEASAVLKAVEEILGQS